MRLTKKYTLNQVEDEIVGKRGTPSRDAYENELKLELIGEMIKKARKERNLTQAQLGKLVGVQKAQISKLETNARNVTIDTVLKVFHALKAQVNFKVTLANEKLTFS